MIAGTFSTVLFSISNNRYIYILFNVEIKSIFLKLITLKGFS